MTGAYAQQWSGPGAWAEQWGRGCGSQDDRTREARHGGGGRHGGDRHGGGGGHSGGGRHGRHGRPEGPGLALDALAGWMMTRGGGRGGPGHHGPSPEAMEKLEAVMAMRQMRGKGPSPFGGGRGPRGRGRRRRGDVRLAVLRLLAEEPRNGYGLMQTIEERSGGNWRPSPGSMYPTLSQLEDEGLVRSVQAEGARRLEITDAGREALSERAGEPDPWISEPDTDEHAMSELGPLVIAIGKATWQVASVADARQRTQAAELLSETRRRLYAILAQEPGTPSSDDVTRDDDDGVQDTPEG